jgi:hypothetical protein
VPVGAGTYIQYIDIPIEVECRVLVEHDTDFRLPALYRAFTAWRHYGRCVVVVVVGRFE